MNKTEVEQVVLSREEIKKIISDMAQKGTGPEVAYRKIAKKTGKVGPIFVAECLIDAYGAEAVAKMLASGCYYEVLAYSLAIFKEKGIKMDEICEWLNPEILHPYSLLHYLLVAGATPEVVINRMDNIAIADHFAVLMAAGMKPDEIAQHIKSLDAFRGGEIIVKLAKLGTDINIIARNLRLHEYLQWVGKLNAEGVDQMILVDKIRKEESLDGMYAPYCEAYHEEMMDAISKVESEEERAELIQKIETAKPYDFSDVGSAEEWEKQ